MFPRENKCFKEKIAHFQRENSSFSKRKWLSFEEKIAQFQGENECFEEKINVSKRKWLNFKEKINVSKRK